jgi:asparagine synthase (glutamine-hydrolysing)
MCGIAGMVRFDGLRVDPEVISAMTDRLRHRGPDGEGIWNSGNAGLGHRRLAIIDLAGSPQPMSSADGRTHISFNGEIFNYRDVRARLTYPFRTQGDTEVILAAYDAEGADGINRLRGQFAFALHDSRTGSTWLFRDRLGILPLYYAVDATRLVFASEIKALFPAMASAPAPDLASLDAYLESRSVPAPFTLFEGVRKLPPGHRLCAKFDGTITVEPYWSLPDPGDVLDVDEVEATAMVREALDAAVRDSLVADVPVGAYLSGGVDSSLIVATAARHRDGEPLETFAAGFGDPRSDELPHARAVSARLGSNHHEVIVRPQDFASDWARLTWHRDAPISEPADVAVFHLARRAREVVKVVLSGEGSDELFAGYPKHRFSGISEAVGVVPAFLRTPALSRAERLLPADQRRLRVAVRALAGKTSDERAAAWFSPFTARERQQLLGDLPRHPRQADLLGRDSLDRMLRRDIQRGWLADNLLERGDRMSMAASLELRPPFLDHRLVELAARLPSRMKLRNGTGKWVVKEIARTNLPSEIVDRPKAGFVVPLDSWFRGDLKALAFDRLLRHDSFVGNVLDRQNVHRLLDDHAKGRRDEAIRIWTLLCLETWHDTCLREGDTHGERLTG